MTSKKIPGYITPYEASALLGYKNDKSFYRKRSEWWYKDLPIREVIINAGRGDFLIHKGDLIKYKSDILRFHRNRSK